MRGLGEQTLAGLEEVGVSDWKRGSKEIKDGGGLDRVTCESLETWGRVCE